MLIIESKIKINIPPYQTAPTEINLYGCYQLLKLSPEVMPIASSTPPHDAPTPSIPRPRPPCFRGGRPMAPIREGRLTHPVSANSGREESRAGGRVGIRNVSGRAGRAGHRTGHNQGSNLARKCRLLSRTISQQHFSPSPNASESSARPRSALVQVKKWPIRTRSHGECFLLSQSPSAPHSCSSLFPFL